MADQGKPFPFGAKTIEELEARDAAKKGAVPPVAEPPAAEPVVTEPTKAAEPPKKEEPKAEPTKVNWLEEVNKAYKTEFKTPEDFGKVFEKAKKADEYEPKISAFADTESKYKKQLEELQSSLNPLSYFSSQESYVAEQLRKQHPDKSPYLLQEIVTSDNKTMDDVKVLIKHKLLENPDLIGGERGAEDLVYEEFGIDPSTPKEEWTTTQQNKIKVAARSARKEWDSLKSTVTLPKIQTTEEREAERTRIAAEKQAKLAPLRETFSKFDKFTEQIEDGKVLDITVPDEYKESLPEIFNAYFVDAGLEVNDESLKSIEKLKRAMFLESNIKQIYKVIEGDVETRMRAERDKLLNNTTPPNTQSGLEVESDERKKFSKEYGLGKLLAKK